ncbi:MAG: 30S ribosomal protein S16 [Flavobacteriales bacterium CG18_big_fil_WC_8_21_14_2_50_32_9]|nr:MAG: 30S ribosomal protein S16 [Flavobacteriales bacterium CG18_big_fil_WC_8_21_14_2_50_32_9]
MPTKIRLQRFGKKSYAFFHVVVADSRAPRDGKFIERIGTYNPNTNPATIDVDFDRALYWVKTGAQPTDTCKALLSYKGVLHKDHLDRGVIKGALTQEQADKKFEAWKKEKEGKIEGKKEGLSKSKEDQQKAALKAEKEANEKKAAAIAAKMTPPVEEAPVEEVPATEEAPVTEAKAEETPATEEAPATEAKAEETPAAEVTEDKKED